MAGVAVSHISYVLKGFDMAPYVDYLMFSPLNPITNPTPRPNATLNYRGNHKQPFSVSHESHGGMEIIGGEEWPLGYSTIYVTTISPPHNPL
jgi:hypothetical protein